MRIKKKGPYKFRVKLDLNDDFVEQTNQHIYLPSQISCEVTKVSAGIKRRATEVAMTNQQILTEQLEGIVAINLHVVENLRRNIRFAHQETNIPPPPMITAVTPILHIAFQTINQFLLSESDAGAADRIIAFVSLQTRKLLNESEHWYADDTFKVCPQVF